MCLIATDAIAILGYAGLGATSLETEPSTWMSNVLRGRKFSLEQSLRLLEDAVNKELPRHIAGMHGKIPARHLIAVPAIVGDEPRFYAIDLVVEPNGTVSRARLERRSAPIHGLDSPPPSRFAMLGSGAAEAWRNRAKWSRNLMRIIKAHDKGKVSPKIVADQLAALNHDVYLRNPNGAVGPECIVAWLYRKGAIQNRGGGHQFYDGSTREHSAEPIPTIATGKDMTALCGTFWPYFMESAESFHSGRGLIPVDEAAIDADLAKLPKGPNEKLR